MEILQRADYGKDFCLFDDKQQLITLYGLPHIVKDIQQRFESTNNQRNEILNAIPTVVQDQLIKTERSSTDESPFIKPFIETSSTEKASTKKPLIETSSTEKASTKKPLVETSSVGLPLSENLPAIESLDLNVAESPLHLSSHQSNIRKPQLRSIVFEIDEPGFEVSINDKFGELLAIVNTKCVLERKILYHKFKFEFREPK